VLDLSLWRSYNQCLYVKVMSLQSIHNLANSPRTFNSLILEFQIFFSILMQSPLPITKYNIGRKMTILPKFESWLVCFVSWIASDSFIHHFSFNLHQTFLFYLCNLISPWFLAYEFIISYIWTPIPFSVLVKGHILGLHSIA
jgi:hypothetical protein